MAKTLSRLNSDYLQLLHLRSTYFLCPNRNGCFSNTAMSLISFHSLVAGFQMPSLAPFLPLLIVLTPPFLLYISLLQNILYSYRIIITLILKSKQPAGAITKSRYEVERGWGDKRR